MKIYRCRHTVEAARWTDTDENRELFAAWFNKHDHAFETRGSEIVLPDPNLKPITAALGQWVVLWDNEFLVMDDEQFTNTYEVGGDAR
jgi:hypothetical protein